MDKSIAKKEKRTRRHNRIRARVSGTADKPRLATYRSNTTIYAQIIDDIQGKTLASVDSRKVSGDGVRAKARAVGVQVATLAKNVGVSKVVFDRGGFLYTGSIQELAEGAREAGLEM